MNRKYIISIAIIIATLFASCEKWEEPAPVEPVKMTPTMTLKEFKALYQGKPTAINDESIVIAGKVNSTDKSGNIYKSLYIEDETAGLELKLGKTGLYNNYPQGMTIYIKPSNLYLGTYGGSVQLGAASDNPKYETSYFEAQALINATVFRGERGEALSPTVISRPSEINGNVVCKLVKLENMRYDGGNAYINNQNTPIDTWAISEADNEGKRPYGQHYFYMDFKKIVVRTSGYAKFANTKTGLVKGDMVNLTGLLTVFNGTYQLLLLNLDGVETL